MKQNLYIFSNTVLRRKDNTLLVETSEDHASHKADLDEKDTEVLLPPDSGTCGSRGKFIPPENVEAIYTFGEVKFNSRFLSFASKNSIPVHVFNYYGNYTGSFMPTADISSGNIAIEQAKFFLDYAKRVSIAKSIIYSASQNSVNNLKYYNYRNVPLKEDIASLSELIKSIKSVSSIGELMGIEGNIKSNYYACWKKVFNSEVDFEKRVRRPPDNMINSLISFGNVVLYSVCLNEIYRTGLLPSIGFLHSTGDNRFPLSFDIAEIYKPLIVDKTIFKLVNLDMVKEEDFFRKGDLMYMKDTVKKTYVENLENRLKTTILHPVMKRNVSYRTLIRLDCYNLINHIKNNKFFSPYVSDV